MDASPVYGDRDQGGKHRSGEEEELELFNFDFELLAPKTKGYMGLELRKVCTVCGELKTLSLKEQRR